MLWRAIGRGPLSTVAVAALAGLPWAGPTAQLRRGQGILRKFNSGGSCRIMKEAKQRDIASFFGGKPLSSKPKAPFVGAVTKDAPSKRPATSTAAEPEEASGSLGGEGAENVRQPLKRLRKAGDSTAKHTVQLAVSRLGCLAAAACTVAPLLLTLPGLQGKT